MICKVCGKEFTGVKYSGEYEDICSTECFHNLYWSKKIKAKEIDTYRFPIINGIMYYIGEEDAKEEMRGFAGRKFMIIFKDGTIIKTTNLWENGKIPKQFHAAISDDAVFCVC